jgi:hypothetical protein
VLSVKPLFVTLVTKKPGKQLRRVGTSVRQVACVSLAIGGILYRLDEIEDVQGCGVGKLKNVIMRWVTGDECKIRIASNNPITREGGMQRRE